MTSKPAGHPDATRPRNIQLLDGGDVVASREEDRARGGPRTRVADEVSLKDVANVAGVSTATVSRALRGLTSVAPETRERVARAARELGYVAAFNASSFASGRTNSVGMVVPFVDRWFFSKIIVSAEQELRRYGLDIVLYSVGRDEAQRTRFFEELPMRRRVDAVVVLCLPLQPAEVAALGQLKVPVAMLGHHVDGFSSVSIDDRTAAATAVRHLVNLGHRDIALISGGTPAELGFTAPDLRRSGYLDALAEAGIHPRPEWEAAGGFTAAGGDRAMSKLLSVRERPTAVFAMSDEMALGALGSLRRHGLAVPGDVSLIGFDDHELAESLELTTVAQPVLDEGKLLAQLVLEQLSGPAPSRGIVAPTHLVVRRSTAAPANQAS
ncbi:LacI family DNA-binding transcriptional regulator [Amycolatopsis sp. Hca4]|uniref:LacI family DNA-binding transcriptional regulator n=1 Tax=Amycolatopsis sp. Hca4 TaxID=2742131 RepID=UPI0015902DB6|nr:LacI family DNA-binding transcriptional regulator [Amycolatopsis sp. Hca4]QKV73927.1 LacI family DNA-binding transcriptional regulator [Amycolatopsis sp. Hca4]